MCRLVKLVWCLWFHVSKVRSTPLAARERYRVAGEPMQNTSPDEVCTGVW